MRPTRIGLVAGAVGVAATTVAIAGPGASTGPSSSQSPYLVPTAAGVEVKSILTVGDSVNARPDGTPYRLVGIPDGLGAFENDDKKSFTLLMNHELTGAAGIQRAHGATGAFVSKWTVDEKTLKVTRGDDLIRNIATWNTATGTWNAPAKGIALSRLCSADLAAAGAFLDRRTGKGTRKRIFMSGEESGTEGRVFAHLLDGTSYELPRLGKLSWENAVANPDGREKTVVVGTDDGTDGQVYVYVGSKTTAGGTVEKAGLANGVLYGIKVDNYGAESNGAVPTDGTRFSLAGLGDVSGKSGAQLNADSNAAGITKFLRPEDSSWDPKHPEVLYFTTTNAFNAPSRLWKLTFDDVAKPELGGTITAVLKGTEGQQMLDNLTVNDRGQVLLQEDIGNQDPLGKVWLFDPKSGTLTKIAQHDPALFTPGAAGFLTRDEESSGIIPAPFLGKDWYLLDVQAHSPLGGELVEGGQVLAMKVKLKDS
jgi:secreted PhoX family phosphatase